MRTPLNHRPVPGAVMRGGGDRCRSVRDPNSAGISVSRPERTAVDCETRRVPHQVVDLNRRPGWARVDLRGEPDPRAAAHA
ncbi:hypothetical protein ACWELJ_17980, partial [Nocardia sp. NPDC004582]